MHKSCKKGECTRYNILYIHLLDGALDRTRTCDPLIRSQILYPAELQAHAQISFIIIAHRSSDCKYNFLFLAFFFIQQKYVNFSRQADCLCAILKPAGFVPDCPHTRAAPSFLKGRVRPCRFFFLLPSASCSAFHTRMQLPRKNSTTQLTARFQNRPFSRRTSCAGCTLPSI